MNDQGLKHDVMEVPVEHSEKSLKVVSSAVDSQRLIDIFLSNKSPQTIAAYRKDLKDFARFLGVEDGNIDEVARLFLSNGRGSANSFSAEYRTHLEERGLSPATINRRLSALRALVEQAGTLGLVSWELKIKGVKSTAYKDTEGPGTFKVREMLSLLESRKEKSDKKGGTIKVPRIVRDYAIVRLLYDIALRRGEVVSLDLEDVDLERCSLRVMGKGQSEKQILDLPEPTVEALQEWIDVRGDKTGALFTKGKGKRLTGTAVWYIIRNIGEEVGVTTRPHGLRHSSITACVEQFPLTDIQQFSRHKKIETVAVYADRKKKIQKKIATFVSATA
ncbi:tyrosine-type recombinase/integrase [Thermodesulfobacteriota bacterium]